MKQIWTALALGGALAISGCTDSPPPLTSPSMDVARVPTTISVPKLRPTEGAVDPHASAPKRLVQPDDPIGGCYDICDGGDPGETTSDPDADAELDGITLLRAYTEAYWERDVLKGHALMTFQFVDHANQDMTLYTYRPDGGMIGSLKFSTARIWPVIMPQALDMETSGSIPGPTCGGRGFGVSQHLISGTAAGRTLSFSGPSESQMMYQSKCQQISETSGQTQETVEGTQLSGGLRICHRLDHYSSSGEYIYTETLYCYDVYAA